MFQFWEKRIIFQDDSFFVKVGSELENVFNHDKVVDPENLDLNLIDTGRILVQSPIVICLGIRLLVHFE